MNSFQLLVNNNEKKVWLSKEENKDEKIYTEIKKSKESKESKNLSNKKIKVYKAKSKRI